MLGLINTLQDQSIGILTRHGIVPSGVGVLRWRIKDGDPQGNKLGVELVDVCTAIHMKCQMVKPRRIAVIFPRFPAPLARSSAMKRHAVSPSRWTNTPLPSCRAPRGLGGSQQRQDGIIKGHCAVRISNSEVEMAQGSTDHEVLRLI